MDFPFARNEINDFLNKAYEMVDDPSTDSIVSWGPNGRTFVVWKPLEDSRDFLIKRHLGITNFSRFESYGFRKIVSGQQVEYLCNDFVRGHPNLLEKIGDRYMANLEAYYEKTYKPFNDRLKNCKTREECDLAIKEQKEIFAKDRKERILATWKFFPAEELVEDQLQRVQI